MGDSENTSTKKRAAGRELSRDNPGLDDEEDTSELATGTFKRASDEVLATRKIVKVRRTQTTSAPSSNPFAGIRLVPPTEKSGSASEVKSDAQTVGDKTGSDEANGKDVSHEETKKDGEHIVEPVTDKIDTSEAESVPTMQNVVQNSTVVSESAIPKVDDNLLAESNKIENEDPSRKDETENKELVVSDKAENDECGSGSKIENEDSARGDKNENEDLARDKNEIKEPGDGTEIQNKETEDQAKTENEGKKEDGSEAEASKEAAPLSSFQQLSSSRNAFTGLAGTGFSTSTFSFGNIPKDGVGLSASFGLSNNGSSSLFGTSGSSTVSKSDKSGFPSMQEVAVETGEENERAVFNADSILFEFMDGSWKERGKGELKVNIPTSSGGTGRARILMRARGNYRLILNASLYPDMKLTNMDKKGITFACINSTNEGKEDGLSTFACKFKDASIVEEFRAAVTEHKGKASTVLKTPENSP